MRLTGRGSVCPAGAPVGVISNLGGEQSTVPCPWCGGGGVRVPGIDAQSAWGADGSKTAA